MIDEDIRTFMISILGSLWAEPGMITEAFSPQIAGTQRIWYRRSSANNDLLLNAACQITTTEFDVEVVSNDIAEAQDIAATLKTAINGYAGPMGNSTALLAEVTDHDDDYQPQGLGEGDEGFYFAGLAVSIIHT